MNALFFCTMTLCFILYRTQKDRRWFFIGGYFFLQTILELIIRFTEVHNSLTIWFNAVFGELTTIKGLFYSLLLFDMVFLLCSVLDLQVKPRYLIAPAFICFFLISVSIVKEKNMIFYGVYFMPCELFYIAWSYFGLKKIQQTQMHESLKVFRHVLTLVIAATLVIFLEDLYSSWSYGLYNTFIGCTEPGDPSAYVKARSYSESMLQIILAAVTLHVGWTKLSPHFSGVPSTPTKVSVQEPLIPDATASHPSTAEKRARFAAQISLSAREQEVFPLLLDNCSIQEISDVLIISPGTVKYHTHNIYQKAEVRDRVELILKVDSFGDTSAV